MSGEREKSKNKYKMGRELFLFVVGGFCGALSTLFVESRYQAWEKAQPIVPQPPGVTASETVFPFRNESTQESRVLLADFQVLDPPQPYGGIGEFSPPDEIEFNYPEHYDPIRNIFRCVITDLKATPGEHGMAIAKITNYPGSDSHLYGRLTLWYGNPENLRPLHFDPTWVPVVRH